MNKDRFNHNFESCINPLFNCSLEVESIKYFFLHCQHYTNTHKNLLNTVETIDNSILNIIDDDLVETLLFENCNMFFYVLVQYIIKGKNSNKSLQNLI